MLRALQHSWAKIRKVTPHYYTAELAWNCIAAEKQIRYCKENDAIVPQNFLKQGSGGQHLKFS
jgi:hypothetical protein